MGGAGGTYAGVTRVVLAAKDALVLGAAFFAEWLCSDERFIPPVDTS